MQCVELTRFPGGSWLGLTFASAGAVASALSGDLQRGTDIWYMRLCAETLLTTAASRAHSAGVAALAMVRRQLTGLKPM